MAKPRKTATALQAFTDKKARIDSALERIKAMSGNHFGVSPDEVNWGHVGTLNYYAELLNRITDAETFNPGLTK